MQEALLLHELAGGLHSMFIVELPAADVALGCPIFLSKLEERG